MIKWFKREFREGNYYQKSTLILGVIFSTLSLLQWVLTAICVIMLPLDQRADASWNCGILIHGSVAIVFSVMTLVFVLLHKLLRWDYKRQ